MVNKGNGTATGQGIEGAMGKWRARATQWFGHGEHERLGVKGTHEE